MARIQASLADVSTEFKPVDPDVYESEIDGVEEVKEDEKIHYIVTHQIKSPGDFFNRKLKDYIYIHKKNGELNEFGLSQLKRYFEATVGEDRANSEDADTDELIHQHLRIQVGMEEYEFDNKLTGVKEKRGRNKIEAFASL